MTEKQVVPRDSKGRWLKGKPPGPGRSPMKKEERYYRLTIESVTDEDWVEIVIKAVKQAKQGQWRAREWLANYIIGRPVQVIDANVNNKTIEVIYVDDWRNDSD